MIGFRLLYVGLILGVLVPQIARAQDTAVLLETPEISEEYQSTLRLKGVQSDVQYYDPNGPKPDLQTTEKPKPQEERTTRSRSGVSEFDPATALIAGAILFVILFLFYKFGGAGSVVLRSDAENAKRAKSGRTRQATSAPVDMQSFDGILNNPDRQQALISLAQLLIYKAVSANDLLLQRSWTARDVLRRMPKDSRYLPELSALVLKGELVHFGERDVSEEEFADFAARAKPLLRELSL
ncbi:hypothetical protein [Amylibacter sp. IMCC11727]|uniref:hypothetical protein n=1 Tax=Amylibacter sp. IMCC11727 TaxID=3039851 RepID=UPI00244E309B|nr:hypothetical protein [Amylibacter sp. IMCC11727]WGI21261.1 hypothetical protein QBD29_14240 [Amylibacter sp. IMCC11727]